MKPPMPSDLAGLAEREAAPKKSRTHTVRHKDGGTLTLDGYTRGMAIKLACTECMGFEAHPKDCTSELCPLYPFRRLTFATRTRKDETDGED